MFWKVQISPITINTAFKFHLFAFKYFLDFDSRLLFLAQLPKHFILTQFANANKFLQFHVLANVFRTF